ncbi:MAG: hypothetical protein RKP20_14090 [Candidatus Competibacter sp.]|nr:hypothetical protein [Candidatus Competibacter sp.]
MRVLAYVCLGFGLVRSREPQALWEIAGLLVAERFCQEIGIGATPDSLLHPDIEIPTQGEETLFGLLTADGCDPALLAWREALCGMTKTVFCPAEASMTCYRRQPPGCTTFGWPPSTWATGRSGSTRPLG